MSSSNTAAADLPHDGGLYGDYLEGAQAIARYLGPPWTERKVYHARETNALPIRRKQGIGLYAFKSELLAALKSPDTLTSRAP